MKEGKKFRLLEGYGVVAILMVALFVVMSIVNKNFMSYSNMFNLARATAVSGILAIAMTFVIITGGIDLSVGTHVGLAGMIVTLLSVNHIMPIGLAVIVALISTAAVGLLNGVLIYDGKLPPFIATMGVMTITRSIILIISNSRNITGLPESLLSLAKIKIIGIPFMACVWIVVIIFAFIVFKYTTFGRNVFACGSNVEAARLSGISVRWTTYGVFILSGVLCGIGGILATARVASGVPTLGDGYEMDAIAATVVGGTSMNGGVGYIGGTVVGSILIATITNAGTLLGYNTNITRIFIGVLLIVAVLIDKFRK